MQNMHLFKVSKRKKKKYLDYLLPKFHLVNSILMPDLFFFSQKIEGKQTSNTGIHLWKKLQWILGFSFSINKFHSMFSVNNVQNKSQKNTTSLRTGLCVCGKRLSFLLYFWKSSSIWLPPVRHLSEFILSPPSLTINPVLGNLQQYILAWVHD